MGKGKGIRILSVIIVLSISVEKKVTNHSWLLDLEYCCSLLIGCCLGDMLQGSLITEEETFMEAWMENRIFSNGLRNAEQGSNILCVRLLFIINTAKNGSNRLGAIKLVPVKGSSSYSGSISIYIDL